MTNLKFYPTIGQRYKAEKKQKHGELYNWEESKKV